MARSRRRNADIGGFDLSPENAAGDEFDESDDGGLISSAPVVELVDLYGNGGDGRPLDNLFAGIDGEAAGEAVDAMNAALATGDNPLSIVNQLAAILGVSQARAETIARTEMLGAWRDAQSINFRANSDVLDGWIWSADLAGACIACVMMDGTVHTLDEDLSSHPNCECCQLPLTKSWDDILGDIEGLDLSGLDETDFLSQGFEDGQDWFLAQPEAYQVEVLGPAKFEAWQSGEMELLDFVGQRDAGAWGNEIYERSLREIRAEGAAESVERQTVAEFLAERKAAELDAIYERGLEEIGLDANVYLGHTTAEAEAATTVADLRAEADKIEQLYAGNDVFEQQRWIPRITDRLEGNEAFEDLVFKLGGEKSYDRERTTIEKIWDAYQSAGGVAREPLEVAFQDAVAKEFDLSVQSWASDAARAEAAALYGEDEAGLRAVARAMYDETQQWLRDHDISEITLYRAESWGRSTPPADVLFDGEPHLRTIGLKPVSSFSANLEKALEYTGNGAKDSMIEAMTMPADHIFSVPETGFGSFHDAEMTMLGGDDVFVTVAQRAGHEYNVDDLYQAFADNLSRTLVERTTLADVTGAAEAATAAATEAATEGVKIITTAYDGTDLTPQIEQASASLFGEAKTPEELAQLIGAPPGAEVAIVPDYKGDLSLYMRGPITDSGGYPYMNWVDGHMVREEREYVATRTMYRDGEELVIYNASFFMGEAYQGQGLGLQVFSDEVQNAIDAGISHIKTDAAGDGLIPLGTEDRANGYYTWARMGYIGDLPQKSLDRLGAAIADGTAPSEWGSYTTVQELMQTSAGRDWWKANGSAWEGVFDLSDGSLSRKMLSDYLREKGMYTQADAIATGGA